MSCIEVGIASPELGVFLAQLSYFTFYSPRGFLVALTTNKDDESVRWLEYTELSSDRPKNDI